MSAHKDLFIHHNEIKLEAQFFKTKLNNEFAVILCHPHPQYGGNMQNNVVSSVFSRLTKEDISCLRFNFRGVGRSSGTHSGGIGEIEDVKACEDFLIKENFEKLLICGYSYGAAIGCSTVNYSDKIVGFIAISFPWDFMGEEFKKWSQTEKPKLFIQGNRDSIANYKKFHKHYEHYQEPKAFFIIQGANHFYRRFEDQVAAKVSRYCKENFS